ncbi:transcription factor HES-5-like [Protopterus annectens]|uniref:transcription factor HES-5-like n=1 Tax=Protopterus annectens TaxID=7888 RepID=UPI001CF9556D|nr:transcription factor HES-5-like [Protopterus annectens]
MGLGNLSMTHTTDLTNDKEKQKLRKPLVEKMRRDRMNGSIEKLRQILEKIFPEKNSSSKVEKADILEMTVSFLKQQQEVQNKARTSLENSSLLEYKEGYSRCLQKTQRFFSCCESSKKLQMKVWDNLQQVTVTENISLPESPATPSPCQLFSQQATINTVPLIWRPWLI